MKSLSFLGPEHFYSGPHAAIFESMRELDERGDAITPFKVSAGCEHSQTMEEAGGLVRYLAGAVAAASTIYNAVGDAQELVQLAQRRLMITACRDTADALADEDIPGTAAEHAARLNNQIENLLRVGADFEDDFTVTTKILDELKDIRKPFSTGIAKLDQAMGGGLYPGKSYGFAARKKVGKTILAGTIACNLASAKVKHLFICGEMSPQEIHQRTLARLTDSFPSAFRSDYGQSAEFMNRVAFAARNSTRCTLYHNAPGLTFQELRRVVATAIYRHGVKGIILDYWQLVGGKRNSQSTAEHLDEVAQWIADFGRKHGVWSITMAQLNQEGNTRGGEGMRLAFDQVYALRGMGEAEDVSVPYRWMEMLDTRYTAWANIGSADKPGLVVREKGPFFEQDDVDSPLYV